jgi:hypothetical protein
MPLPVGSVRPSMALAAMAASMALPPLRMIVQRHLGGQGLAGGGHGPGGQHLGAAEALIGFDPVPGEGRAGGGQQQGEQKGSDGSAISWAETPDNFDSMSIKIADATVERLSLPARLLYS